MDLKLNADRFTGGEYVSLYNQYRPKPPKDLLYQCLRYLDVDKAGLILDLGCGTGLSTRALSDIGHKIIGIEPSEAMLEVANDCTSEDHISYKQGFAHDTGILSHSVDLVTCSQSFHWMEPKSTLKEVDRLLKGNGVLLIYDADWPPTVNFQYEQFYRQLFDNVKKLTQQLGQEIAHKWDKNQHLTQVQQSNYFNYVKESYYHKTEEFEVKNLVGLALSQGGLEALLKRGFTEAEIGITKFKEQMESTQDLVERITYNYRVIFGIRRIVL